MAKLIYTAITSLDGYTEDEEGRFDWAVPDAEVHAFVNDLERPVGTHLYGRRMFRDDGRLAGSATSSGCRADFAQLWRARTVSLPDIVLQALTEHMRAFPPGPDGLVFTNEQGDPIRRSRFSDIWRPVAKVAGLEPGTGMHALRHFYASALIRHGESVTVVQARLPRLVGDRLPSDRGRRRQCGRWRSWVIGDTWRVHGDARSGVSRWFEHRRSSGYFHQPRGTDDCSSGGRRGR